MVINGKRLFAARPIKDMLDYKATEHGVSHGLAEVGYDIRIKQQITFARNSRMRFVLTTDVDHVNEKVKATTLETTGRFALASAIEEFQMPLDMMGVVHDKSTWARRGLSVFNTVIEPGWCGFLTLELVYHGEGELTIPAGAGIAQVVFHRIIEDAAYSGKYQNQANRPVPAINA